MVNRIEYFDVLRAIAIFAVIYIHTIGIGYTNEIYSVNYNLSVFTRQIVNFGVPLFLVISGYFMSKKNITTLKDYIFFLRKSLPRVFLPFHSLVFILQYYQNNIWCKYKNSY